MPTASFLNVGRDQVRSFGRRIGQTFDLIVDRLIVSTEPVGVLACVLLPRCDNEQLDELMRCLSVAE